MSSEERKEIFTMKHYKRVKATYDRGYVNAMDKIRVFIESKP